MKKFIFVSVFFYGVFGFIPLMANSLGDIYASVGYVLVPYNQLGGGDRIVSGVQVRAGVYLTPHISVEANTGSGIFDHFETGDYQEYPATLDVKLDYVFGYYVRAEYDVFEYFTLQGLFGYTKAKVSGTLVLPDLPGYGDYSVDDIREDGALSYGLGIEYSRNGKVAFNFEYLENMDKEELDVRAFVVGMKFYL